MLIKRKRNEILQRKVEVNYDKKTRIYHVTMSKRVPPLFPTDEDVWEPMREFQVKHKIRALKLYDAMIP